MAEPSTTQAAPFSLTRVVGWLAVVATTLGSTACGHGGWPAAPAQKPLNATVPTGASADARVTTNAAEESVPQSELSRATNSFLKHLSSETWTRCALKSLSPWASTAMGREHCALQRAPKLSSRPG